MIGVYLVPTRASTDAQGRVLREPQFRDIARSCPGWTNSWAHIPRGALVPYTIFVVKADDLAPMNAQAGAIRLCSGAKLQAALDSDLTARTIPAAIRTRLTAMGIDTTGTLTLRQLFYRIAQRLEPALNDNSYGA